MFEEIKHEYVTSLPLNIQVKIARMLSASGLSHHDVEWAMSQRLSRLEDLIDVIRALDFT